MDSLLQAVFIIVDSPCTLSMWKELLVLITYPLMNEWDMVPLNVHPYRLKEKTGSHNDYFN